MKRVVTKDGRTLYKGEDGRWFKHANFKTGGQISFQEKRGKNGSIDVYAGSEFIGNADDRKEVEELKEEYYAEREAKIAKIKDELRYAKDALHDPNISDKWTRQSYRNKITKLTAELKELEG